MKVHYVPKITEKIRKEILKAKADNREIDFIELTDREMIQFRRELNKSGPAMPRRISPLQARVEYMGVEIVKENTTEVQFRGYGNPEEF